MQEAITEWWELPVGTAGTFYGDGVWNAAGKPPPAASALESQEKRSDDGARTPVVPWYTSKWMTNPSCRGYPWY